MKYEINAENIKCEGCAGTIRDALGRVGGVHEVTVEVATGLVTVEADEGLRETITATLRETGYPERNSG